MPQTEEGLARAHLDANNDALVTVAPLLEMVGDWSNFLALSPDQDCELMRKHERTGRPLQISILKTKNGTI